MGPAHWSRLVGGGNVDDVAAGESDFIDGCFTKVSNVVDLADGAFEGCSGLKTIKLEPGDTFLLYTDGVNEALDSAGDEFGMERMLDIFKAQSSKTSAGLVDSLTTELNRFVGNAAQNDDITLIAVQKQ